MQTSSQRSTRTRKPTAALFSTTAARLIEQIQAEAREQLLADLSAKDRIAVLHGFDAETKRVRISGVNIEIYDGKGNSVDLYRHHTEPEGWIGHTYMEGYWHPARWYGSQTLTDGNGRKWRHDLEPLVCDDFGDLVEVPA